MTKDVVESARLTRLGAYFRVRPRLADLHAALNEVGLVLATADVHEGWRNATTSIPFDRHAQQQQQGRHAFVIVGYNDDGLLVQNSWGGDWGEKGVSTWTYDDWAANIIDMWVLRLAAAVGPAAQRHAIPQFARNKNARISAASFSQSESRDPAPLRLDVVGHIMKFEEGRLETRGHYHSDRETLQESFKIIKESDKNYKHVLIHFTGLKRKESAFAGALRDALPVFKDKRVYPIYVMPEATLAADLYELVERVISDANETAGLRASRAKSRAIEGRLAETASRLRRVLESSARHSFKGGGAANPSARAIFADMFDTLSGCDIAFHFSAHGAGAHFLLGFCENIANFKKLPIISSVTLLAPMIDAQDLEKHLHLIGPRNSGAKQLIRNVEIACLGSEADKADDFSPGYPKSWPQLWTEAYQLGARRASLPTPKLLVNDGNARKFAEVAAKAGKAVTFKELKSMNATALTHEMLESHPDVIDYLLTRILGQQTMSAHSA
jgi:hypothetical protein